MPSGPREIKSEGAWPVHLGENWLLGDLTSVYNYLVGEVKEDGTRLQLELHGDRTKGNCQASDPEKFR